MNLLRTKTIEQCVQSTEEPEHQLKKSLSGLDLMLFGIGVIIGTGIFVLTGVASHDKAGPAVSISFLLAAIACGLAGLCYAEFASTVPVAGSAYTYSYATIGEFPAWIIGWDLILEMALGAAVVAVGWSQYFASLMDTIGIHLPKAIAGGTDAVINLPAILIVLLLTGILVTGIRMSSRVTNVIVAIKLAIVLFVIGAGLFFIKAKNYTPFIPPAQSSEGVSGVKAPLIQLIFGLPPSTFGIAGVVTAAAVVFFAYMGFDIVATTAEEARRPQRDVPIGILGSLAVCTVLYIAVSTVVTGMQKFSSLDRHAPLAEAFKAVGHEGFATIISVGALAGLTSVMLILMLGQSRVFFAMSRDNLLPKSLAKVHPTFGSPYRISLIVGGVVAILAGVIPLEALAELVNIGTLFAFVLVSIGVIILRRTRPDLPRTFRVPFVPVIPIAAVVACSYLMLNLPAETWLRFAAWLAVGCVIYFGFSMRRSVVHTAQASLEAVDEVPSPANKSAVTDGLERQQPEA